MSSPEAPKPREGRPWMVALGFVLAVTGLLILIGQAILYGMIG